MEEPPFWTLEGGGARIFARIAAFEAVRDCGLNVSVISGFSAEAIAAVLFLADVRHSRIQKMLNDKTHRKLTTVRHGLTSTCAALTSAA